MAKPRKKVAAPAAPTVSPGETQAGVSLRSLRQGSDFEVGEGDAKRRGRVAWQWDDVTMVDWLISFDDAPGLRWWERARWSKQPESVPSNTLVVLITDPGAPATGGGAADDDPLARSVDGGMFSGRK